MAHDDNAIYDKDNDDNDNVYDEKKIVGHDDNIDDNDNDDDEDVVKLLVMQG